MPTPQRYRTKPIEVTAVQLQVPTTLVVLGGPQLAPPGTWLIITSTGHVSVCTPEHFSATYEPIAP